MLELLTKIYGMLDSDKNKGETVKINGDIKGLGPGPTILSLYILRVSSYAMYRVGGAALADQNFY